MRPRVAVFLDGFDEEYQTSSWRKCVAKWTSIGEAHYLIGNLNFERGAFDEAAEAWLCGVTAFEVAKRLSDENDPEREDVLAKLQASVERSELWIRRLSAGDQALGRRQVVRLLRAGWRFQSMRSGNSLH